MSDYMKNFMRERRKKRRAKFVELLGGKCVSCGTKSNLQFDHIDPKKKKHNFNQIQDGNESIIHDELKKCVLLCAKCHLEKTKKNNEFVNKDKSPSTHGTVWHYKKFKCRCDECKKAMSDYYFDRK